MKRDEFTWKTYSSTSALIEFTNQQENSTDDLFKVTCENEGVVKESYLAGTKCASSRRNHSDKEISLPLLETITQSESAPHVSIGCSIDRRRLFPINQPQCGRP